MNERATPTDVGVAGVQLTINGVLQPTQSEGGQSGHLSFITPEPMINGAIWADPLHAPIIIEWAVSEVRKGSCF